MATTKANASNALFLITWFMGSINIEKIHPLESGFLRLRFRRDRRPGFAIEPIWSFYPKYAYEIASKLVRWTATYIKLRRIYLRIKTDPNRYSYTDTAMTAVADDEAQTHELFNSDAARAYVAQNKRVKDIVDGAAHEHVHHHSHAERANRHRSRRRNNQPILASRFCARIRCGRSYILPSMPTAPASGCAAKAAITAFAFSISAALGV